VAQRCCAQHAGAAVHLLTSGQRTPELTEACDRDGVSCAALARQEAPCSLILPGPDRTIIRSPAGASPGGLDAAHRDAVLRLGDHASVVACVSGKDAALAAATVAAGNGALRVFQPTGSLPAELTQLLLFTADDVLCNLDEWSRLGQALGHPTLAAGEDAPEAPEAAAALLRALRRRGWAGRQAAVCTLGRHGSVVADWQRDRIQYLHLALPEGSQAPSTPAGAGDRFLGEWIFWRLSWSGRGHLRDPIAATALRVTHGVAQWLRLRRGDYEVHCRPC
jgi:hypothetical protein